MNNLNFEKTGGLLPVIVQDYRNLQVLMLGYMNQEALNITRTTKQVTFFSRSKNRIWTKGETSGNTLSVKKIISDCDQDTLLILAKPNGPTCHTGNQSCFATQGNFLYELEASLEDRLRSGDQDSYTKKLMDQGLNKVIQKFGEESVELIIEAKDQNKNLFLNEAADMLYHFLVLLQAKETSLKEVEDKLIERRKK
ncbi:bifunctional phosphoribosyl-AMP cyclohydrolase/phosphoribosyl-ATP diphosphatase HisIE [uncultured Mesonia sp.]|uniref:bifunctional phosphoribosyl-AMP cyclohydrolase/phosphoribosyl-ATP diphosphatase HisIE n=1 Tax=uncultured Mesonia sp. TaxID=399731 RepID=UPI00374FD2CF